MSTNISRRTVAKGAAWSVPAVAVATAAPALAASATCGPTVAQLNACFVPASALQVPGTPTYSLYSSDGTDASATMNWGLISACGASGSGSNFGNGSVSVLMYDGAGQTQMGQPTVTFTDGSKYTGVVTAGATGSGLIDTGFDMGSTISWTIPDGAQKGGYSDWQGATISVPFNFVYTKPDGTGTCTVPFTFTWTVPSNGGLDGIIDNMSNPTIS